MLLLCGEVTFISPPLSFILPSHNCSTKNTEAGFPPGVINIVNGAAETATLLSTHPDVRAVTFVGTSHVADLIADLPYGFHVETGDTRSLMDVIRIGRQLQEEQLAEIFEKNTGHVKAHCSAAHSLATFINQIILPIQLEKRPCAAQVPSRA